MAKKAIYFALGGHIATQNASFQRLAELLENRGFEIYGAKDGFECFESGECYRLKSSDIPYNFAGFVAGAGRNSLTAKDGKIDERKIERAKKFLTSGGFDVAVGSGGDDHGKQMDILQKTLEGKIGVYVVNKTMDNDLGGVDGQSGAPYTDFTNGFHTAVVSGLSMIKQHFSGAWTNNLPYLIGHFGRESNWVGIALTYWGNADRIIYGELPESHPGHSIEEINRLIVESQDINEQRYGRRFAMVIVPEGTRIRGMQSASSDLVDAHGHHKLQPEVLVSNIKLALEKQFGLKTQTAGITYEMRNFSPTTLDISLARRSAEEIAKAIEQGNAGVESTFKIIDDGAPKIETGVAPIERVCQKRFASYYRNPLLKLDTFETTAEIGTYYRALFGDREPLQSWLPKKMTSLNVFRD